jgi:phage/plasmid-associated DNA primase
LGGRTLESFLVLTGSGRNGKDTLITYLLRATLGDSLYYGGASATLTSKKSSGVNQEIANMHMKRCVVYTEPDKKNNLICATLKELTGGASINARGIYQSNCTTVLQATHILLCNDIPTLDTADEAISQRMKIVRFPAMFKTEADIAELPRDTPNLYVQDTKYKDRAWIDTYKMSFFHILNRAYRNFKQSYNIRQVPKSIADLGKAYMADSDEFVGWFNHQYKKTNNESDVVKIADIYDALQRSELYENLNKREKRMMNRKKLISDISSNPTLKGLFRIRSMINGVDYKNVVLMYRVRLPAEMHGDDE